MWDRALRALGQTSGALADPTRAIIFLGSLYCLGVALLSQEAVNFLAGGCDEPGTVGDPGCRALAAWGYTTQRIVPAVVVAGLTLIALKRRRVALVHLGLALGLLLSVVAPLVVQNYIPGGR